MKVNDKSKKTLLKNNKRHHHASDFRKGVPFGYNQKGRLY